MGKKKRSTRKQIAAALTNGIFMQLSEMGVWAIHLHIGKELMNEYKYLTMEDLFTAADTSNLDEVHITLKARPEKYVNVDPNTMEIEDDG